ncbi:MAG: DUF3179 domain-containing (seleno)protein [Halobacteriales archaeon]|nr:DUF3179 domain-containing (seleno)protein [Halobacteriales archaeon]
MNRREYLAAAAALTGGLAGCAGSPAGAATTSPTATPRPAEPVARSGVPQNVCEEPVRDIDIIEIVDPAFGPDWGDVEVGGQYGELTDEDVIVGVERDGSARAYPLAILWYHEIVNDDFGGPLLASYCPLCKSGIVAERRVEAEPTTFRVSGLLWRPEGIRAEAAKSANRVFGADMTSGETEVLNAGNLVMVDDATGSYWSQLLARAICGARNGDELTIVPSTVARWGEWRADHPETDILLPPPASGIASD